jgi:hypothetical protein
MSFLQNKLRGDDFFTKRSVLKVLVERLQSECNERLQFYYIAFMTDALGSSKGKVATVLN